MGKKYIIVTGSVSSGIGKGVVVASLSKIFDSMGYRACPIKFDGFFNFDLETMNPYHKKPEVLWKGEEVFISYDGIACDSDIGLYERFIGKEISGKNNITNGQIFRKFLEKEKASKSGELIKIRPHLIEEYLKRIEEISEDYEIVIIEVGGTVGENENLFFIQAMKYLLLKNKDDVISIHISYIPFESKLKYFLKNDDKTIIDETYKLKPAMLGIELVSSMGIHPNIVICRCKQELNDNIRKRIAESSFLNYNRVFFLEDLDSIYRIPEILIEKKIPNFICKDLKIDFKTPNIKDLSDYLKERSLFKNTIRIGIAGNTESIDSYISLKEALEHACKSLKIKLDLIWLENVPVDEFLKNINGIIITESSERLEDKLYCAKYARENNLPALGISFGYQIMLFDIIKNLFDLELTFRQCDNKNKESCLFLEDNVKIGVSEYEIDRNSLLFKIYGKDKIIKRHRYKNKLNEKLVSQIKNQNVLFSGKSNNSIYCVECKNKNFHIGVIYHPEYDSKINKPEPLIKQFLLNVIKNVRH